MRRREFIRIMGGAAAWPFAAGAQQPIAQIGFLRAATAAGYAKLFEAFQVGLHDLGYLEGKNIVMHSRWAEEKYDRLPLLANELVALKVDVLVTHGTPATGALRQATATIPIVMAVSGDADKTGLIQTLARPGSNVTGLTYFAADQTSKRLEVMKEIIPSLHRVAFLANPRNQVLPLELQAMEDAVRSLKIAYEPFEVRNPVELDKIFSEIARHNFDVVQIAQDGMLVANAESEHANSSHSLALLRERHERPCSCRAANNLDELASPHSITSSAIASKPGGKVRPSVLAVFRLITNSNFVGWTTGKSAGFAPLRIFPV
jgi:putative ABC transport system substrate-binding protein